ncbi:MAG: Uncharacterized protein FD147_501 [Chloroflexi bacterium]|nr:MAG: Uncharacterized protein FD147_501 [Chloroflexota bacterium]
MTKTPEDLPSDMETKNELQEPMASPEPSRRISFNPQKHWIIITLITFLAGSLGGFGIGRYSVQREMAAEPGHSNIMQELSGEINPQGGFIIPVMYDDVGPKLLAAGAIDLNTFEQLYQQSGQPLTEQEIEILTKGSQNQIVITSENAHFLLNYFWALGLTNKNPLLDNGPIQEASDGKIDRFASTGGWTIGAKPVNELFSSSAIISLSAEQQARVEEVAKAVYRPCCDNPTHFPDCNHGMAMLGLLELMASQNATTEEMFLAAKYINAFWFPQQTLEQAIYFKATENKNYEDVDAKLIVGQQYSSGSGFQNKHQWLSQNGLLEQSSKSGNNCGV